MAFKLSDIAPRLAKARDDFLAERIRIYRERDRLITRRLKLERLVAHRELQLARGQYGRIHVQLTPEVSATARSGRGRKSRNYVYQRQQKLLSAQQELDQVNRKLASTDLQPI